MSAVMVNDTLINTSLLLSVTTQHLGWLDKWAAVFRFGERDVVEVMFDSETEAYEAVRNVYNKLNEVV